MGKIIYDFIILGGGCAGLTAGIYAGRAKMKTLLIEKQTAGGQAATTDEIENYPGFDKITGPELSERMLKQAKSFGMEYLISDVTGVNLSGTIKEIIASSEKYCCKTVLLATGGIPKQVGFEGEEAFRGRGVSYCATCDGFFFNGKDVFVIGGGYSAAEEALYLTRFAKKVTILIRKGQFRCARSLAERVINHPNIEVMFHTELIKVYGDKLLKGAVLRNNQTGEETEYRTSEEGETFGVFVFAGYKPVSNLFQGQVAIDQEGYIITNNNMETNLPGVFAAGDIRRKELRQIVTAVSDGAIAATRAEQYLNEL